MRIRDYVKMSCLLGRGRKTKKIIILLVFISIFLYLVINSMASSVHDMVELLENTPVFVTLVAEDDRDMTLYQRMKAEAEKDPDIVDVYPFVERIGVEVEGILEGQVTCMDIQSYSEAMENYLVSGSGPGEKEILLPKYMYEFNEEKYVDGDTFIGKELVVEVTDYDKKKHQMKFRVSGTYDNIYMVTENQLMLVSPDDAYELKKYSMEGIEKKLKMDMKKSGDYDRSHYIGYEMRYQCAVYVDDSSHLQEVMDRYADAEWMTYVVPGENTMDSMFQFLKFTGNILVVILLGIAVLCIVFMLLHDIDGRKREIALYEAMGYTKKQMMILLTMEYMAGIIKSIAFAVITAFIMIRLENVFIIKKMSMVYGVLKMHVEPESVMMAGVMAGVMAVFIAVQCRIRMSTISLDRELKED
ncbi:MAG: FtsX-like permease family protein [Lachnospiraceae bacterium]|nr:FtsX-like permease family protein [Lachnospiraceae bacterium]